MNHSIATKSPFLVGAMLILLSFAPMLGNVVVVSLRQKIIPSELLGRVTSAYRMVALGALPMGAVFGGLVAQQFGLTTPYWSASINLTVTAFAVLFVVNNRTIAEAVSLQL